MYEFSHGLREAVFLFVLEDQDSENWLMSAIGPSRHLVRRSGMSAFRVITEVAAACVKRRF
jgi:hypothetical protein